MNELTIIVPAYNEVSRLEGAVLTNLSALDELGIQGVVLIVDDGSRDGTREEAVRIVNESSRVRCVHHEVNRGIGAGIRTGLLEAKSEFVICSAVDSPLDATTLAPFWAAHYGADVVFGYREEKPGYNSFMVVNSRIYHLLLRTVAGIPFRDVNWHQMYRCAIFDNFNIQFDGIAMTAEVAIKAHHLGFIIKEVPCAMLEREGGGGSASRFKVMAKTGLDLLHLLGLCLIRNIRPLGKPKA